MKAKRRSKVIIALALVALAAIVIFAIISKPYRTQSPPQDITIATATRGGTYAPLGTELAEILQALRGSLIKKAEAVNPSLST